MLRRMGTFLWRTILLIKEVARRELGNMLVLHEYPLSIVDHAGFRRFVHALQPLFKLHTRNTIRYTLLCFYLIYLLSTLFYAMTK